MSHGYFGELRRSVLPCLRWSMMTTFKTSKSTLSRSSEFDDLVIPFVVPRHVSPPELGLNLLFERSPRQ